MQEGTHVRLSSRKAIPGLSASRTTRILVGDVEFLEHSKCQRLVASPLVFDQQDVSLPHSVPPEAESEVEGRTWSTAPSAHVLPPCRSTICRTLARRTPEDREALRQMQALKMTKLSTYSESIQHRLAHVTTYLGRRILTASSWAREQLTVTAGLKFKPWAKSQPRS